MAGCLIPQRSKQGICTNCYAELTQRELGLFSLNSNFYLHVFILQTSHIHTHQSWLKINDIMTDRKPIHTLYAFSPTLSKRLIALSQTIETTLHLFAQIEQSDLKMRSQIPEN